MRAISKIVGLFIFVLLVVGSASAQTLPIITDKGPERTHKQQHERTPFYKVVGGKQVPCGELAEFRSGIWRAFLIGGDILSTPHFATRAEGESWLKVSCPVEGKTGHD